MAFYECERAGVMVFVAAHADVWVAADLTGRTFALALCSWSRLDDGRRRRRRGVGCLRSRGGGCRGICDGRGWSAGRWSGLRFGSR
jgi:hypothetical protein